MQDKCSVHRLGIEADFLLIAVQPYCLLCVLNGAETITDRIETTLDQKVTENEVGQTIVRARGSRVIG